MFFDVVKFFLLCSVIRRHFLFSILFPCAPLRRCHSPRVLIMKNIPSVKCVYVVTRTYSMPTIKKISNTALSEHLVFHSLRSLHISAKIHCALRLLHALRATRCEPSTFFFSSVVCYFLLLLSVCASFHVDSYHFSRLPFLRISVDFVCVFLIFMLVYYSMGAHFLFRIRLISRARPPARSMAGWLFKWIFRRVCVCVCARECICFGLFAILRSCCVSAPNVLNVLCLCMLECGGRALM